MHRTLKSLPFAVWISLAVAAHSAHAQGVEVGRHSRPRITQAIDEQKRVTLRGNTRREAKPSNDRGTVANSFRLEHLLLQLQRSPEQQRAVEQFIDDLQNPNSPNFHKWITAQEFGDRFGVAQADLDAITRWLESHGFEVNAVYPSGMVIDFSGSAEQIRKAFHTEIHHFELNGEKHIANDTDPQIPASLAPVIAGVVSLHDFRPMAMHKMRVPRPQFTTTDPFGGTAYAMVPADLATVYNLNPLFNAGYSGQGQTIVVIEDTDVFRASDWTTFRSTLGLSSYTSGSFNSVHPAPPSGANNCGAPGVIAPNDAEAILDAEWASAAAPSAAIQLAACADTSTTFGGLIALQNILNSSTQPPGIVSISYGECETVNGAAANAAYSSAYQQAVAEGVSIFVAAGDSGAAACDNSVSEATHGIGANAFASTPYNVAVGGTDFSDTYSGTNSTYWDSTNSTNFGSALSYIPEIPWNDSCAGVLLTNYLGYSSTYGQDSLCNSLYGGFVQTTVAGGGGPSGCATGAPAISGVVSGTCQGWPKPSWQSVLGNPNDGVRDTPDVSLFAADGLWSHYYVFCWSDTAGGGAACGSDPSAWSGAGGTSFAAPILAGIQALINQRTNSRQGNPNPVYYQLAAGEYGSSGNSSCNSSNGTAVGSSCVFYDVTLGDMDVNCTGNANCFNPDGSGFQGVLSTTNNSYSPAYGTNVGWDFATGIGTINAANLANNWPGAGSIPGFSLSANPAALSITQGTNGATTITITSLNGFNGNVTLSASGLPNGVTAAFSPNPATSSSTLTLTAISTAGTGTVTVTVSGTSGTLSSSASISLTVNAAQTPNFTLSASPTTVTLAQDSNSTSSISIAPLNGFSGNVTLSASGLPSGVSAVFAPNPSTTNSTLTLSASSTATTGNATVTITGNSGTLTNTSSIALTVRTVTATSLPSGWTDGDVGSTGLAGSASYSNSTFTLQGAGAQIFGNADAFHFVYQPLSGDVSITARLTSMQGGAGYRAAGVVIRETLNPASTNAKSAYWPAYGYDYFDVRSSTGGGTLEPGANGATPPTWIRVQRSGNSFTAFASANGLEWTQLGTTQTISMAQNVYVGLAVTSGTTTALTTATFDNVSFTSATTPAPVISSVSATTGSIGSQVLISGSGFGANQGSSLVTLNNLPTTINSWSNSSITFTIPSAATTGVLAVSVAPSMNNSNPVYFIVTTQPLPSGWLDRDIGQVGLIGSAIYSNGTFTVQGAGAQIYGTTDAFHFAYQPLSGDGTIVARVVSVTGGSGYRAAGVMIRETLTATSANAKLAFWATYGTDYFDDRATTGGSTAEPGQTTATPPTWIKVVRSGNSFSAFASTNGSAWTQLGATQTISMAQNVYVGLAVTSGSTSASSTATFDNVSIVTPANQPPSFSLSASPNTLSVAQGATTTSTITITSQNGFAGNVTLAASGLPSGVTATFTTNPATSTSTLTLTASSSATTGNVTVIVTGTSGTLSSTASINLTVTAAQPPNFTLSASPSTLTLVQGANGTSSISIVPLNGFSGNVTFSATGLPNSMTAAFSPNPSTSTSTVTLSASNTATPGNATVTVTGTSGTLSNTTTIALTVRAATAPLPSGWADGDIGSTGLPGIASYSNGTFTIQGAGAQIYGSSDAFHFVYQALSGDASIVARLASTQGGSSYAAAGVMIREALTPGSTNASPVFWPAYGLDYFDVRSTTGGSTSGPGQSATVPVWIKVQRSGSSFTAFTSANGLEWTQLGTTQTISMAQSVYVGLAVTSGTTTALTTATFDNVSFTSATTPAPVISSVSATTGSIGSQVLISGSGFGANQGSSLVTLNNLPTTINSWSNSSITFTIPSAATTGVLAVSVAPSMNNSNPVYFIVTTQPLPSGWLDRDIGQVGLIGSAIYSNGTFTVQGAGAQIYGTTDAFHFAYQPLSGDGTIVARVVSVTGGSGYRAAGVMIRETLTATSANAKLAFWATYGTDYFDDRATTGGSTAEPGQTTATPPTWIKVVRSGNSFSAFASTNGSAWTQLGATQTISMAQNVYVGLAVTSGSTSAPSTATFDNVAVTSP